MLAEIKDIFLDRQHDFRNHPDFREVQRDDLMHLRSFAKMLGISERELALPADDETTAFTDYASNVTTPSPGTSSTRRAKLSTTGSTRSRMSGQSTLSPLYEEEQPDDADDGDEDMADIGPKKRRRVRSSVGSIGGSVGSSFTRSTLRSGRSGPTIDEETGESSSEDGISAQSTDESG